MYTEKSRAALAILVVCLMGTVFVGTFIFGGLGICAKAWCALVSVGFCFVVLMILAFLLVCLLLGDLCGSLGDLGQVPTLVV